MKTRFGDATLSVMLDIRHPQAYLALHPAARLAESHAIDIDWLPVVVGPLKAPTTPQPADDRGVRHRRNRAHAIAREIDTYSQVQGLVLHEYYRAPDPAALDLAWLWVRERHPARLVAFLAEAFRAYWALEFDISNPVAVAALLEAFGAGGPGFAEWRTGAGTALRDALADELAERGVGRVPTYVVGDEIFVGRQHLPMIQWILGGRKGSGPI